MIIFSRALEVLPPTYRRYRFNYALTVAVDDASNADVDDVSNVVD